MRKLFIVLGIVGGLLWAKKHFSNQPAEVKTPTREEVIAEQIGKAAAARRGLKVQSSTEPNITAAIPAAAASSTDPTSTSASADPAAATRTVVDEKEAAGLLAQI